MKKVLSVLASLLFTCTAFAQNCADTNNIYKFYYQGKKYEVVKEKKRWDSAASCAVARGGYLAQIGSQAENDTIYSRITNGARVTPGYTIVADGGGIAYIWIGATDKTTEGNWKWDGRNTGTGTTFWTGQGAAGTGTGAAVGGAFVNWGKSSTGTIQEPDDYNNAQDAAGMALASWPYGSASQWNDINDSNKLYFVIEYDSVARTGFNLPEIDETLVAIYPVPASTEVRFSVPAPTYTLTIFSLEGARILSENRDKQSTPLDISWLKPGYYWASIEWEGKAMVTKPLVIIR